MTIKDKERERIFSALDKKFLGNDIECLDDQELLEATKKIDTERIDFCLEWEHRLDQKQALEMSIKWLNRLKDRLDTAPFSIRDRRSAKDKGEVFAALNERFSPDQKFMEVFALPAWLVKNYDLDRDRAETLVEEWWFEVQRKFKATEIAGYLQETFKLKEADATALVENMMEEARKKAETTAVVS